MNELTKDTLVRDINKNKMFKDTDKDGVPNIIDCRPYNPKMQGALSWLIAKKEGRTYDEVEENRVQSRRNKALEIEEGKKFEEQLRKKELAVTRDEREKQRMILARKRIEIMAKQREMELTKRYSAPRQSFTQGLVGLMGTPPLAKPQTRIKVKRHKPTIRHIKIKGRKVKRHKPTIRHIKIKGRKVKVIYRQVKQKGEKKKAMPKLLDDGYLLGGIQ